MSPDANQMEIRCKVRRVRAHGNRGSQMEIGWKFDAEQMEIRRVRWTSNVKSEGSRHTDIRTVRWKSNAEHMEIRWIR